MVRKRNIDADLLRMAIYEMPIVVSGFTSSYNNNIDQLIEDKINTMVQATLLNFKHQLIEVIDKSAMLHSACLLCAQKEGECPPQG